MRVSAIAVLVVSLLVTGARTAGAVDPGEGEPCTACIDNAGAASTYLCKNMEATGTKTQCGPITLPDLPGVMWDVHINTVQAACPFPTMTIEDSDQVTEGAPSVWHTVGVLTGPISPSVSKVVPILGKLRRVIRATFADVTDVLCTGISVVVSPNR